LRRYDTGIRSVREFVAAHGTATGAVAGVRPSWTGGA
jgi:hypothetical protein